MVLAPNVAWAQSDEAQSDEAPQGRREFAPRRRPSVRPKPPPRARFSIGLENVFGYSSTTQQLTPENDTAASKAVTERSTLSFLGGGQTNPFALPTFALDVLLPVNITIGVGIHYISDTIESESESRLTTTTVKTTTKAEIANLGGQVRLGATLEVGRVRFWPRLGLAWHEITTTTTAPAAQSGGTSVSSDSKSSGQALTVELPVVLGLGPFGGLALGPALYMPIGGSYESGEQKGKLVTSGFAINASGYFTL